MSEENMNIMILRKSPMTANISADDNNLRSPTNKNREMMVSLGENYNKISLKGNNDLESIEEVFQTEFDKE